eukprot:CAMPEP_0182457104 /NCGR_PEP_ID=MMETSP1319-20130603/2767_1 /TAXON_ID=172717 /ORGANISM="Bolidomonas pacifica, Strain RCC208" /LENGTH=197 /DNA_ID=CAMNT_0024655503 /DNA_START=212 /DNA_END=801 /DNA_ORIENTATION=-
MKFKNGGKLSDYDSEGKKKKKAKKKKKSSAKHAGAGEAAAGAPSSSSTSSAAAAGMKKRQGSGHLIHSGTVVTGQGTLFTRELSVGDALIVQNPSSGKEEMRVVRMIVGDLNLTISSGFTFSGGGGTQKFWYISAPKETKTEDEVRAEKEAAFRDGVDKASGSSQGGTVEIRTKNGSGGYNISRQRVDGEVSREEML